MSAGAVVEPVLTNPVRHAEWSGGGLFGEDPELTPTEVRYGGAFRLPLTDDWSWTLPDEGRWALARMELGAPAVYENLLLAGSSRKSGLFVLDRSDGRLIRTIAMAGTVQAAPLVVMGTEERTRQVPVAGSDQMMERTETVSVLDGFIVADTFGNVVRLDRDLEPVWEAPYEAGGAIYRSPVVSGEMVLVSTARDQVAAVNLADGKWIWSYKRDVARTSMELAILGSPSPVVYEDSILAGFSDGALVGLDSRSGRMLWESRVGDGQFPDIEAEPIVVDGVIVVAAYDGPMVGLDPTTRRVLWTVKDSGAVSSMENASGSIVTADSKGRVRSVVAETGEVEWTWEKKGRLFGPPKRAGGSILVAAVDGTLYALDRYEGSLQWTYRPTDGGRIAGVTSAITVHGRQVLFPTSGGELISLVSESGVVSDQSEEPGYRSDRPLGW